MASRSGRSMRKIADKAVHEHERRDPHLNRMQVKRIAKRACGRGKSR